MDVEQNITDHITPEIISTTDGLEYLSSGDKDIVISIGLLIFLFILFLSLLYNHFGRKLKIRFLEFPVFTVLLSFLVGAFFKLRDEKSVLLKVLAMNEDVFFVLLLPPMIFHSGFTLTSVQCSHILRNFGTVLVFSVICTIISFGVCGILMYCAGLLNLSVLLSLQESFAFGALISSTDPVSVIVLFKSFRPIPTFQALVFGESLINDAISIVLYREIVRAEPNDIFVACFNFLTCFSFSLLIGVIVGFMASLIFKYMGLHKDSNRTLETALFFLFPWISYSVSEGLELSGIVSLCFTGLTMGKYTICNLSVPAQSVCSVVFDAIELLAETAVFAFLGLAVFAFQHSQFLRLYFTGFFILTFARFCSVGISAALVNFFREDQILNKRVQAALALCGIRGAVAFALSERASLDFRGVPGSAMISLTLFYSLFTIVFVGSGIQFVLSKLGMFETAETINYSSLNLHTSTETESHNEKIEIERLLPPLTSIRSMMKQHGVLGTSKVFLSYLDLRIMIPFFTHTVPTCGDSECSSPSAKLTTTSS